MTDRLKRAVVFRLRADTLRRMGQDWQDSATRDSVYALARDYEQMADDLEKSALADGITYHDPASWPWGLRPRAGPGMTRSHQAFAARRTSRTQ